MIKESTTIVDVEPGCLWVEAVQSSTCGSCTARAGCGQRLLAGIQAQTSRVKVLLSSNDRATYKVGEHIDICIPDDVVVKGSLFVYLFPLLALLMSAGLVDYWFSRELLSAGAGLIGLVGGGLVVRIVTGLSSNERHLQPTVLMENVAMENTDIRNEQVNREIDALIKL